MAEHIEGVELTEELKSTKITNGVYLITNNNEAIIVFKTGNVWNQDYVLSDGTIIIGSHENISMTKKGVINLTLKSL